MVLAELLRLRPATPASAATLIVLPGTVPGGCFRKCQWPYGDNTELLRLTTHLGIKFL